MKVPALTFCLTWLSLSGTALYSHTIKYVKPVASGTGNGSSWANAFTSLSTALAQLKTCNTTDSLLVAKGNYSAGAPFEMDKLLAVILGGYPTGGGTRNAAANPVIVQGVVNVRKSMRIDGIKLMQ